MKLSEYLADIERDRAILVGEWSVERLRLALEWHNLHGRRGDQHCTRECAASVYEGLVTTAPLPDDERPRGDGSVSDVADVPQHPSQGAGTDPSPAPLCGYVMATCRNEPGHPGEHWHPSLAPQGGSERSGG